MRLSLDFKEENLCVKVYDIATKEVISTFDSYKRAGVDLLIREQTISEKCKTKKAVYSPRLNRLVVVRLTRKDKDKNE